MRRALAQVLFALGLPAVLFAVWWVASDTSTQVYSPPLRTILTAFGDVWTGDRISADVLPSILRLLAGFSVAAVLGVAAGIGDTMKIFVIASGCVWPVLLNTVEGVRAVDPVLSETARAYGLRGGVRLRHLLLRSASPQIFTGLRQALSIGIILMVISEMFAASNGLGFAIVQFQRSFAIPEMWSGILLLGFLGFLLSVLFQLVERRALAWYHGLRASRRQP